MSAATSAAARPSLGEAFNAWPSEIAFTRPKSLRKGGDGGARLPKVTLEALKLPKRAARPQPTHEPWMHREHKATVEALRPPNTSASAVAFVPIAWRVLATCVAVSALCVPIDAETRMLPAVKVSVMSFGSITTRVDVRAARKPTLSNESTVSSTCTVHVTMLV